ncbi:MAG: hybrid sensor histidine kinase/response regulator [Thermoplasmatota archaeon]
MSRSRAIILEDEAIVASHLKTTLTGLGYDVVATFASGEEASSRVRDLAPDLVTMDIRLKGEMSGIEAARLIRDRSDAAIVFLTVLSDDVTIEAMLTGEPAGIVLKPFNESDLRAAVGLAARRRVAELGRKAAVAASVDLAADRGKNVDPSREVQRLRTEFLNAAAHELATPLTPIKIQLHNLKTRSESQFTREEENAIEIIDRNTDRLTEVLHKIVEAARATPNHPETTSQLHDLSRLLNAAVDDHRPAAAAANISLDVDVPDSITVACDGERIRKVVENLLSNALKYTPRGGHVSVEAQVISEHVRVCVRDTGRGFEPSAEARLFDPFVRIDEKDAEAQGIAGLGLYASKEIIEHHGGRIWAESDGPGRGATFSFVLPATQRLPDVARTEEPRDPTRR